MVVGGKGGVVVITEEDAERPIGAPTPEPRHEQSWQPARLVATVAAVIGLCIVGDSLLYNILPLQASALGLRLGWCKPVINA